MKTLWGLFAFSLFDAICPVNENGEAVGFPVEYLKSKQADQRDQRLGLADATLTKR